MSTRSEGAQNVLALLAGLDDGDVEALLARGERLATGIGGTTVRVRVDSSDVFVKQLPLTAAERNKVGSTANHFRLPAACHYGIGSPGFGVGREVAAHELTSRWVHEGATDTFPLLYHWRVIDQRCPTDISEFEGREPPLRWGPYWPLVRDRVNALSRAESNVVLFLEHVPHTLDGWLRENFARSDDAGAAAFSDAIEQIISATAWMRAYGLQHLDVHPQNILVRNGRLLLTDFGLAMHQDFELDLHERAFFAAHMGYDRDAGLTSLLHWTLAELGFGPRRDRMPCWGLWPLTAAPTSST